ncbi:hypothetical protein FOA43_002744 [Brettanomyces nanus]|uniref:RRM domain-containing protein n=1 Tax=Eeniella nana TaxID=13502 RepID=A0A875RPS4_EENNA|nr:uncharacterized protein FOA43_002744 [Brettanomyces nanus]QPG75390.1 hypothetical protein FOA43_002744 [Brettanomyces nanus]
MTSIERPKDLRLHVGGLSNSLVEDIDDLEKRFSKFGKIVKQFEVHEKVITGYHYAYITMRLTKYEFKKLQALFNGVQYKGAELTVALANQDFHERWIKDAKRPDIKQRKSKLYAILAMRRQQRINHSEDNPFETYSEIIGQMRKTPRKTDLKKATMRVIINGKLRLPRCQKNKLWGYDKTKNDKDLSWEYVGGKWRDGTGHVVEHHVLDDKLSDPTVVKMDEDTEGNDGEDAEDENEKERNKQLLELLMGNYDFQKPADVEVEKDEEFESGGSDYELEGAKISEDEEESGEDNRDHSIQSQKSLVEDYQKQHPEYLKKEQIDDDTDSMDEDFIPVSGPERKSNLADGKNETEKLRSLLNPVTEHGFKFSLMDDEEEEEADPNATKIEPAAETVVEPATEPVVEPVIKSVMQPAIKAKRDVGLFFSHSDSPFLLAQTQLSKLKTIKVSESGYEDWFWENRGSLNREFRRKRREVTKRNRRKNKYTAVI